MASIDMSNKVVCQNWDKEFVDLVSGALTINDLIGGHNSPIYQPANRTGARGNTTTVELLYGGAKLVKGNYDSRLTKNDAVKFAADTVKLEQVNFAYDEGHKNNSIEQTSVPVDLANAVQNRAAQDIQSYLTCSVWAQLGGAAVQNEGGNDCAGENPLTPPTNIVSGPMSADLILDALTLAKKLRMQPVQGLATGANWVLYMNPNDSASLRKAADAGKNNWFDLAKAIAIAGRRGEMLSTDLLGQIYGVELRENIWLPEGTAYLLAGQAVIFQVGEGFDTIIKTHNEVLDSTIWHVKTYSVLGLKKTQFNGRDFGVVALQLGGK